MPDQPIKPVEPPASDRASNWPDPDRERAQPGDVLGIERGGETTSLGESAEDEDKRRKDAEREVEGRK
ncbi:MAG TPA: hypothetical protein VHD57_06235 [Vicinamibacterales bacterium]|jgi:hypothetical protein|nr:hypothetical protein [Vicinamibacterales bacterium]HWB16797.1 hypothetical protein [Vicinamibacterales bacterium]